MPGEDISIRVRLTPNASRDRIDGWENGAAGRSVLRAHVRAVPEKGKANGALLKMLAKQMGIAKTRLTLARGQTSRIKTISVGCDAREAESLIAKLTETDQ